MQAESHEHRQSAQDELTEWYGPADATAIGAPRRRGAEQPVGTSSAAQDDILDISMVDRRGRSAEQPVASSNKPAQFASKVHSAVHAKAYRIHDVSAGGHERFLSHLAFFW